MDHDSNRLFVVTGGPGAGKTALIDALSAKGFATSREVGRRIIQEQVAAGGSALPWADRDAFAASMLRHEIENYHALAGSSGPVFFDRGIPDVLGYMVLENLAITRNAREAAIRLRYSRTVFILPPWREIYETDAERKQSFAVAESTFRAMDGIYRNYGYDPVPVPVGPVAERAMFVMETALNQYQP